MNLISLKDWNSEQINEVLDFALEYKKNYKKYSEVFKGKTLLMLFQKTSTRTRVSFESGFNLLGGHAIFMESRTSNLVLSELKDEIRYLTRNVDMIMARVVKNQDMMTIAEYATVPVINGCDDLYHPCQILADLLTIKETFGTLEGIKTAYIGIRNNVCNELIGGVTKTGGTLYQVTPLKEKNQVIEDIDRQARPTGRWIETDDIREAVMNSDVVYTDTWVNMELFNDPKYEEEKKRIIDTMMPYQVNGELLKLKKGIKVMHDMPMHPGYEITRDAIEDENQIIFQQAENRMWAQNALMLKLMGVY